MNDIVPDENNEAFVVDLTRYTEGIFTEQDVRKRYRLDETQNKLAAIAARKLARIMQCAPKARITSGGRFHPERCR